MEKESMTGNNYQSYIAFMKVQPYCNFGDDLDKQDDYMCVTYSQKYFTKVLGLDFKKIILEKLLKYCNSELKVDSFELIYKNLPVSSCSQDPKKSMIYIIYDVLKGKGLDPHKVTMELIASHLKES